MLASWCSIFSICVFLENLCFSGLRLRGRLHFFFNGAPSSGGRLSTEWFPVRLPAKILLMIVSINHRHQCDGSSHKTQQLNAQNRWVRTRKGLLRLSLMKRLEANGDKKIVRWMGRKQRESVRKKVRVPERERERERFKNECTKKMTGSNKEKIECFEVARKRLS